MTRIHPGLRLACLGLIALIAATAAMAEDAEPQLYINPNIGFNVPGYNYSQSEYPCDIDRVLVDEIIRDAAEDELVIAEAGTADKLRGGRRPVLAIDIDALVLGSEAFTFGTRSDSNLPSVRVTAALIGQAIPEGMTTAKHSCAIAQLNELTPSSNILDLGTTATVCSATHKCLRGLSKDILRWVKPQLAGQ